MAEQTYPAHVVAVQPNTVTLTCIEKLFADRDRDTLCIAEIGIHVGATTERIAQYMDNRGQLHIFDFQDKVDRVLARVNALGYGNVRGFGSSYKMLDSYNWQLMKLINTCGSPIYDYVYLDGAHTWAIDALAFFLADRLLKVGGCIDFDDYGWTLAASPSMNPAAFPLTGDMYTDEQIGLPQVAIIVELLVKRDARYREAVKNKVYQKIA